MVIFDLDSLQQLFLPVDDLTLFLLLALNPLNLNPDFQLGLSKHVLGMLRCVEHLSGGFHQKMFILYVFILQQVVDPKVEALPEVLVNFLLLVLQILQPQLKLALCIQVCAPTRAWKKVP